MSDYILCSVKENETGMRLDQFLASMDQIVSRSQAQRLLKSGNVLLNGVPVSAPSKKISSVNESNEDPMRVDTWKIEKPPILQYPTNPKEWKRAHGWVMKSTIRVSRLSDFTGADHFMKIGSG